MSFTKRPCYEYLSDNENRKGIKQKMMISPQTYVAQYKNCTLEQCVAARDELIEELKEFELDPVYDRDAMMLPTPMTQYSVQVDYLKELCDLIAQKIVDY